MELYKVGELSQITGIKAGTIRFYEKCGFLEPVNRLPNNYRIYNEHHIYQVTICRLVFGGYVNKHLRNASMRIIEAAIEWDLEQYEKVTLDYIELIQKDIDQTNRVIQVVANNINVEDESNTKYTKKQAARLLGVTEESIRNWERNDLIPPSLPYQRRIYSNSVLHRMYLIRLLLNTGYSIMIIRKFFQEYDTNRNIHAIESLMNPGEHEDLCHIADRYLQSLFHLRETGKELHKLLDEMNKV